MEKSPYSQKEEEILNFWRENKIFERSISERPKDKPYVFYDGPPFATGLPHYGHILASTVKDVYPRFFTMQGKRVERRWGWDCHGLPIENIAEKELGIKTKKQIEEYGVEKFNEFCRSKVLRYAEEWKGTIERLGRWVDMDNPYKTMDLEYMESVWWVFKNLWDKKLIYEGYRSMHICPRCETTLSQSEVAEGYKNIKDLSVITEFRLKDEPDTSILAWTTTPWTLIGNVVLAVGADIDYVKIEKKDQRSKKFVQFILAKDCLQRIFGKDKYKTVEEFKGHDLVGLKYQPLFGFDPIKNIKNAENGWQIVEADFITTEDGTGIVHIAPAFGEDDMNLGKKLDLPFIQHVGMDGIIKSGYGGFSGLSVKPANDVRATDKKIIEYLEKKDLLFSSKEYEHSYPHCWRCDTPLINYATTSWFVAVEKIKSEVIELAESINWNPDHLKAGRFGKWLEGARDWSISRQRYWASVLPIWKCDKCNEIKVFGSVAELEEASGQKITDLHKHITDKLDFACMSCDGKMKRVPDVLDTWFDSGSMPYAQMHYPFENKEKFEANFPAEFIGEGIDQTRAWFYYLHILSTAIMGKPAYKNVAVNGIILAEDGKKMSKRLKNYPDPSDIFDRYCADALRFYLMNSVVMQADNLFFKEVDLREIYNKVINTTYNIVSFYEIYKEIGSKSSCEKGNQNVLDQWIISRLQDLILSVEANLNNYETVLSTREIRSFIDDFSTWWLRRSRERFRSESEEDKLSAFDTIHLVLKNLAKVMAPFSPFISENIWQTVRDKNDPISVHLAEWPKAEQELIDEEIEKDMKKARETVEVGHSLRSQKLIRVRQPLEKIYFNVSFGSKQKEFESLILDELNIEQKTNEKKFSSPLKFKQNDLEVIIESEINERLQNLGNIREIIRAIQDKRKKMGLKPSEKISAFYATDFDSEKLTDENKKEIMNSASLKKLENESKQDAEYFEAKISYGKVYIRLSETTKDQ
ncbi:MAG: isoleucine--tRNA ligase [Candidatus Berkelbacteria bacterium]|nr:isoleucine--tRNA ligase [Candidatus Berkelbacteria bacterium]